MKRHTYDDAGGISEVPETTMAWHEWCRVLLFAKGSFDEEIENVREVIRISLPYFTRLRATSDWEISLIDSGVSALIDPNLSGSDRLDGIVSAIHWMLRTSREFRGSFSTCRLKLLPLPESRSRLSDSDIRCFKIVLLEAIETAVAAHSATSQGLDHHRVAA